LIPKANQYIYEPKYTYDYNWVKSLVWFLRYGVHKFSGRTESRTRALTHRRLTRMQYAPAQIFNGGKGITRA